MDGVDPTLTAKLTAALEEQGHAEATPRLRWSGHALHAEVSVPVNQTVASTTELARQAADIEQTVRAALPNVGQVTVVPGYRAHDDQDESTHALSNRNE